MTGVPRISLLILCSLLWGLAMGCKATNGLDSLAHHYPVRSQQREAAQFLISNLPDNDRLTISHSDLLENIDLAFKAREKTPWGKSIPFDIFKHYVLPHRLVNEPFKRYRKYFYEQLLPLVKQSKSILEAAIRVNLWCASQVEYRPSSFWLTAPSDIHNVGFGRCEELAIFFAAAAKSVGIPVRGCWVPAWRHTDDNHVWVEIWDDGKWMPLEAASTVIDPNQNWFLTPAQSAPAIYSLVYGTLHPVEDSVYRQEDNYTTLNVTSNYSKTQRFTVQCFTQEGTPAIAQEIYIWVYNSGHPALVARGITNQYGQCEFILAEGTYIASTGDGIRATTDIIGADTPTHLTADGLLFKSQKLVLSYPRTPKIENKYKPLPHKTLQNLKVAASKATRILTTYQKDCLDEALTTLSKAQGNTDRVMNALKESWPIAPMLAKNYIELSGNENDLASRLLIELDPKDMIHATPAKLATHITAFQHARNLWGETLEYDDESFLSWVVKPRVYDEPFSLWDARVYHEAVALKRDTVENSVLSIIEHINTKPTIKPTPFSPRPKISQMLNIQSGLTLTEKVMLCTAILRHMGIPARTTPLATNFEYYEGSWRLPKIPLDGIDCSPQEFPFLPTQGKAIVVDNHGFIHTPIPNAEGNQACLKKGNAFVVQIKRLSQTKIAGFFNPLNIQQ